MIHLGYPVALAALLAGIGVYGILARRNLVLVLIGVELVLNAANLLLVAAGSRPDSPFQAGAVLTLFIITVAAAEIVVALSIVLVMYRTFGHIDATAAPEDLASDVDSDIDVDGIDDTADSDADNNTDADVPERTEPAGGVR